MGASRERRSLARFFLVRLKIPSSSRNFCGDIATRVCGRLSSVKCPQPMSLAFRVACQGRGLDRHRLFATARSTSDDSMNLEEGLRFSRETEMLSTSRWSRRWLGPRLCDRRQLLPPALVARRYRTPRSRDTYER